MLKYLLDTNIVIYTMKNRPQQVKKRFQKHEGEICISAVTLGELVFGAEHSQQVERNGCNTKKLHRLSCQRQVLDCVVIKHILHYPQSFPTSIFQLTSQD